MIRFDVEFEKWPRPSPWVIRLLIVSLMAVGIAVVFAGVLALASLPS